MTERDDEEQHLLAPFKVMTAYARKSQARYRQEASYLQEHLLLAQLLSDIVGRGAGHLDPGLGEQRARAQHEDHVERRVQRVRRHLRDTVGKP